MLTYLARRLFVMIPTLFMISVLVFVIIQLPPGDFLTTYLNELQAQGEAVDPAKIEFLKRQYGLDQPIYIQYAEWAWGLLQGDLGFSFEYNLPVSDVVGDRLWLSLVLNFSTIIFIYIVNFPIAWDMSPAPWTEASLSLALM